MATFVAPNQTGLFNYWATYTGDSVYDVALDTGWVQVGILTTLVASDVQIEVGEPFSAQARLLDVYTQPLADKLITFSFGGSTVTATTDSSGYAKTTFVAPASTGVVTYSSVFAGDSMRLYQVTITAATNYRIRALTVDGYLSNGLTAVRVVPAITSDTKGVTLDTQPKAVFLSSDLTAWVEVNKDVLTKLGTSSVTFSVDRITVSGFAAAYEVTGRVGGDLIPDSVMKDLPAMP